MQDLSVSEVVLIRVSFYEYFFILLWFFILLNFNGGVPRDEINFFERGPGLTRGTRALPLWLLFRAVGVDAIAASVRAS